MLGAGHHVVALHALDQRGRHLAEQVRVFAVGLLGPAPARMPQDVDADPAVEVGALGPKLLADGVGHPPFEGAVPGGAPGHGHRERGRVVEDDAAGAVGEEEGRDPQPHVPPRGDRPVVVLEVLEGDELDEIPDPGVPRHLVHLLDEAHLARGACPRTLPPRPRVGSRSLGMSVTLKTSGPAGRTNALSVARFGYRHQAT